jgi:uncharacterized membrane protein
MQQQNENKKVNKTTEAAKDASDNKLMGVLSYIIFIVPLLSGAYKTSAFVKYHLNQGIVFVMSYFGWNVLSMIMTSLIQVRSVNWLGYTYSYTPGWLTTLLWLGNVTLVVINIIGIINAARGETKPLPILGKFNINLIK